MVPLGKVGDRHRCFTEPVDLNHVGDLGHCLLQVLDHHWCASVDECLHRTDIRAIDRRAVDEPFDHCRRREQVRHALRLDGFED